MMAAWVAPPQCYAARHADAATHGLSAAQQCSIGRPRSSAGRAASAAFPGRQRLQYAAAGAGFEAVDEFARWSRSWFVHAGHSRRTASTLASSAYRATTAALICICFLTFPAYSPERQRQHSA